MFYDYDIYDYALIQGGIQGFYVTILGANERVPVASSTFCVYLSIF